MCDFLLEEKIPPRRKKDLIDGSDTTMIATAISAIESTTVFALVLANEILARIPGVDSRTDVGPGIYDLYRRIPENAHGYCDYAERKGQHEAPNLAASKLQLVEKWER